MTLLGDAEAALGIGTSDSHVSRLFQHLHDLLNRCGPLVLLEPEQRLVDTGATVTQTPRGIHLAMIK